MPARIDCPPAQREQQLRRDSQVIRRLYELPQPVIAEIDGPCLGAGLALALCCDLRLCASSASFGAVFHRVGLSADFGLSWLLPQAVGAGRAMELLLTADVISAQRAGELGLVQRVLPAGELGAATLALCAQLASGPPLAQAVTKRALHRATSATLPSTLDSEAQSQTLLGKTSDAHEGIAAFLERRQPHFTGQ
jgi:2-(1,2-epoxy-1,2-dihydrophenyl)acetyl-CoA isomerase